VFSYIGRCLVSARSSWQMEARANRERIAASSRVALGFDQKLDFPTTVPADEDALFLKCIEEDNVAKLARELKEGRIRLGSRSTLRVSRPYPDITNRARCCLHYSRLVA
jgi:hypothetical protein